LRFVVGKWRGKVVTKSQIRRLKSQTGETGSLKLYMKKVLLVLALLGFAFSPLMVSQADAAPLKHHGLAVKHHRKMVVKKHAARRLSRRHHKAA
jgi:hypothetical protein